MEEPVLAREDADAKSLVAERTERATADFLREAAHHDVKHAIHKAEHRLAEARCQAVFKQRPFLQHLDKARDAAATQGHAKRSQHTVEAGPWRAAVVAQLDSFEDSVRKPAHEGGLGLGPKGDASSSGGDGDELIVGLRRLRSEVNACTGIQAMEHLEALRRRSAELAARVDPHLGRLTELKIEAKKRVDETEKTDANRAATLRKRAGGGELNELRRDLRLKAQEMHEATAAASIDAVADPRPKRKSVKKQVVQSVLDEPSDAGISNYMRTRRAYLGAEAEVVEEAPPSPPRFRPGGRVDEARALVADVLKTPAEPYAPPPKAKSPAKPKRKARKAPAAAQARVRGPPPELSELKNIVVTRASESQYADRFYRFLVDCSTRGDWRKAVQAYRLMVAKGIVPDARTWRVLLRAVKIGEEGRVALVLLEEIEAQAAQRRAARMVVPVEEIGQLRPRGGGGGRRLAARGPGLQPHAPHARQAEHEHVPGAHGGRRPGAVRVDEGARRRAALPRRAHGGGGGCAVAVRSSIAARHGASAGVQRCCLEACVRLPMATEVYDGVGGARCSRRTWASSSPRPRRAARGDFDSSDHGLFPVRHRMIDVSRFAAAWLASSAPAK